MLRRVVFIAAMLVAWLVLLGWAAQVPISAPWSARAQIVLSGENFISVSGNARPDNEGLQILGATGSESTIQTLRLNELRADDYPILHYHFADFRKTLELTLLFRRRDTPDELHTLTLPWPGNGDVAFNLANVPEWRGEISELGFAEFSTPQLVPFGLGFHPFRLVAAHFTTPSWQGSLRAMFCDWLGNWPWTQRSVHSLGRDTATPRMRSASLILMLGIGISFALGWLILRWRDRHLGSAAIALIGIAWLLLDLDWQATLKWKVDQAQALYADVPAAGRVRVIADLSILDEAQQLSAVIRKQPRGARVLIGADSGYELLRLMYLSLPLSAGMLNSALAENGNTLQSGMLLALYNAPSWRFDPASETVANGATTLTVTPVFQDGLLRVYRMRSDR